MTENQGVADSGPETKEPEARVYELENFGKQERSLLLFLETRAVDYSGAVKTAHMNEADMDLARTWDQIGLIGFGRIAFESLPRPDGSTHWVFLSPDAWRLAHEERMARGCRTFARRTYMKTSEVR